MTWADVFDADPAHQLPHRTWWWWWFIFFFRNPANPARTKQMVLLWGTRNCRRLVINGHRWDHRQDDLARTDHAIDCAGMAAGWWYDGATMHDPLFVDDGPMHAEWNGGGRLALDNGNRYEFDAEKTTQRVMVQRPGLDIALELRPWTDYLSQIVPTGKRYLSHLGYQMQKIRGVDVRGTIGLGGKEEPVEGTAYFQKVRINSPTSPWYWGVFHARDGSYLDYFMPHLGPPALRRTARHNSPWDWGERYLSNSFQFFEAATGDLHKIKNVHMSKRYVADLPVFRLQGEMAGKSIDMEATSYARATWVIRQPVVGPFDNVLHYNEYPANVTAFAFGDRGRRVTLDDLGPVVGNCEHSWGLV
ncbi:MAG: hypothetical protein E6K18_04980 [Methanobacteriota archaeon]|nr:MAG: hypothetical protein E6K18_04980 [Euryarchaeota archaeon]